VLEGTLGMDTSIQEQFTGLWKRFFGEADLPVAFFYTDEVKGVDQVPPSFGHRCIFADLLRVAKGQSLCFSAESIGCFGGRRYLGFPSEMMPQFEYFLSCGIPGELEGERYKKTPELVKEFMKDAPPFEAPGKLIVFKRWDRLQEEDDPEAIIFFACPDVLSGLFTLANFDKSDLNGVFAPFSAGCGSVVQYPYLEGQSDHPRAVLGLFDVSARPFVPADVLSFSVPMDRFVTMVGNMEESFLITESWRKIQRRIGQG